MSLCPHCGLKLSDPSQQNEGSCPNCGFKAWNRDAVESTAFEGNPFVTYFKALKRLLFSPSRFFRSIPLSGGMAGAIAFGLITHWIGSALSYLSGYVWSSKSTNWVNQIAVMMGRGDQIEALGRNARWMRTQERLGEWVTGVGSVVLDPFTTLLWMFVGAALLFMSARLFVGAIGHGSSSHRSRPGLSEVTFDSALRIVAFSQVSTLFACIPFLGRILSFLAGVIFATIGARELYEISGTRALLIVLFPRLLVIALAFAVVATLFILGMAFFFSQLR